MESSSKIVSLILPMIWLTFGVTFCNLHTHSCIMTYYVFQACTVYSSCVLVPFKELSAHRSSVCLHHLPRRLLSSQLPHWWIWHLAPTSCLCKPVTLPTPRTHSIRSSFLPVPCSALRRLLPLPLSNSLQHRHCIAACSHYRHGADFPFPFDHILITLAHIVVT